MARIRTIKPEFWSDEKLSECSLSARLTFVGLWTFADDAGRLEFQPARIRMQIYPCGSVSLAKLSEYLGELTEHSLIRRYVVDGKEYIDIPNFEKHQRINRPTPSRLPEYSLSPHTPVNEDSPLEGKGTGKGGERAKRACTLPEPFDLTPDRARYAAAKIPDADCSALFESFTGKARAKGWKYVDWDQAWQEFVRNAAPGSGHWSSGQYPKVTTSVLGEGKWM